jgi:hypothetical protein
MDKEAFALSPHSQPAVPNVRDYLIIRDTVGLGSDFAAEVVQRDGNLLAVAPGQDNAAQR